MIALGCYSYLLYSDKGFRNIAIYSINKYRLFCLRHLLFDRNFSKTEWSEI